MEFKQYWAKRTILTDWFVTWQSPFIEYCKDKQEVKKEFMHTLSSQETAKFLYQKWCK